MVIDSNRNSFFCLFLPNDIAIESFFELFGLEDFELVMHRLFFDDVNTKTNTFVTDIAIGT